MHLMCNGKNYDLALRLSCKDEIQCYFNFDGRLQLIETFSLVFAGSSWRIEGSAWKVRTNGQCLLASDG